MVINSSNKLSPADRVLAQVLKGERALSPEQRRQLTQTVFGYYRWLGWLRPDGRRAEQIQKALGLAEKFAHHPETFTDAELSEKAVPSWLSEEVVISPAWVRALQTPPKLWLRARPGQGRELAKKLGDCRIPLRHLEEAVEYLGTEDLFRTPEFHAGVFELQDLSSQVVGLVCAPKPGESWWDACAGEGGKMLHLSDLMANRGLIWASDRVRWRLDKLKRRAARAGVFNYRAATWEGGTKLPTKGKFDGVLVDAPCTGVGTWQRNPHARWTTSREDVLELKELQTRMLNHAAGALKPGGRLIYAVCTLTHSETISVTETFERENPVMGRLKIVNPMALEREGQGESSIEIWPQQFGSNGMFIAAWTRTAAG